MNYQNNTNYIDCFTIDKPFDYSNYFKKYNTTNINFLNKKSSNLINIFNKKTVKKIIYRIIII